MHRSTACRTRSTREKLQVVNVLKGTVLLGVQGNFLITDPLPIHVYDDKAQLVDLAKLALARV